MSGRSHFREISVTWLTQTSFSDGMATKNDPLCTSNGYMQGRPTGMDRNRSQNENSFDLLLREAKAKLCKRKA
jgi:hypothetical protein